QYNIWSSLLGYLLFAFIIHASRKHYKQIFNRRLPDGLLILIFAFVADVMKMRMHLFFLFSEPTQEGQLWTLPTSISACTLGLWIFYAHFLVTYCDALRFIVTSTVLIRKSIIKGLGAVTVLQVALLFETNL
ncbi:hypothetical protein PENTCL1PPCAC_21597, partial [Pristionchus entomophagus]